MVRWLICLLSIGIMVSQDDGLPPNFIYLEPIQDFFARDPITLEIIVTDRNEINQVSLFYRFNNDNIFIQRDMQFSNQPVIFNVEIPLDEVKSGFIQYFFWAKDEYNNEAAWPSGGEDLPMILPIYPIKREKVKKEERISKIAEVFEVLGDLEDNLPQYLEIEMLAPSYEVTQSEGVPIIVLSIFDSEEIVDLESVKLLIDDEIVASNNSQDMITFIPINPFDPGFHIVRYETNNTSGEILFKEFSFFMEEKIIEDLDVKKISLKDKIYLKGDLGWNTDYDPSPNKPTDSHKINSSVKFKLGEYNFNLSGLMNTHLYDSDAREQAKHRQPSTRLKFKMHSPYLDLNYGDNSPEFSEFSLKGTRIRGISTKIKWGTWETSFVSGETKHWVDSGFETDQINLWNEGETYKAGDKVYDDGNTWIAVQYTESEPCDFSADTCAINSDWTLLEDSKYSEVSNDVCLGVEPAMYGLNPDTLRSIAFGEDTLGVGGGHYWIWNGSSCEEIFIFSSINMMTGKDGKDTGDLFETYDACRYHCTVPVQYEKGSPIRQLQGFRTSKDFYEHAKFGISAIRSWDVRNTNLVPYSILDEYTYEGNIAAAGDFSFHFNNDQTILSGEYGLSMTIDQTYPNTLILKSTHHIQDSLSLYSYANWEGVDYCYQNQCIDINGDDTLITTPQFVEGIFISDTTLWKEISNTRKKLKKDANILGFNLNDDINGYANGRGVSGLTGPEVGHLIEGGLDSMHLLLKKPTFKVVFKTPIPLSFTELNFQTEMNQAPLNYLSHGSSSVQTDVRNWKNKVGFKLLKNRLALTFGYNKQIKHPWNPESELDGEIKRSITDTKSGSIGISFRNLPSINYSIRLQDREDMIVNISNGSLFHSTSGLKTLSTHTIAPTYKLNLGETSLNLNGNITFVNDLDLLTDTTGCYEILNSNAGNEWGGDSNKCEGDNNFYFTEKNNPLRDSGNFTSTYTGAMSFSFPSLLSLNLGWGMSMNSPNDLRQSKTVITVLSTKLGYKFFKNKLNVTVGGNYVIGFKGGNSFWDSGEELDVDDGEFNQGDIFKDKIELDNNKLTLKSGMQYKMPAQNITIGLNLDYIQAVDNMVATQEKPIFKAKMALKYGF